MKQWHGRSVALRGPFRRLGPADDARLRPLALERAARMKGRTVCFVCDADVLSKDASGLYTAVDPPVIAIVDASLQLRPPVCVQHADLERWPAADYELATWMITNGWGKPMDAALLGDVQ